jgi:hypothetical protein
MAVAEAHEVILGPRDMELIGIAPLVNGTAADQGVAFLVQLAQHAIVLKHLFYPDTCFDFFVIDPCHNMFLLSEPLFTSIAHLHIYTLL